MGWVQPKLAWITIFHMCTKDFVFRSPFHMTLTWLTNSRMVFFDMSKDMDKRIIGKKTGIYRNGNEIIIEVSIDTQSNVDIHIGPYRLNPEGIGIPNRITDTNLNLSEYLSVIVRNNICFGKVQGESGGGSDIYTQDMGVYYGKHSPSCTRLMSVLSHGHTCRKCHALHLQSQTAPPTTKVDTGVQHVMEQMDTGVSSWEEKIHFSSEWPEENEGDMSDVMDKWFPGANDTLKALLITQSWCCRDAALGKDSRSRRYEKEVKSLSLSAWISCPAAYRIWSKYLFLPSEHCLQMIKNSIDKKPGVNMDMIKWMCESCERSKTSKQGGSIFDEMSIQPGIQLEGASDGGMSMTGCVDCGSSNNGIPEANNEACDIQIATYVLQFVFLAYNGFRFPFSYMLTKGIITGELTTLFWDIVNTLGTCGFQIDFVCMDGASVNRAFLNAISDPITSLATNITSYNFKKIACIMDFSHVIKKNRNSLEASADHRNRHLQTPFGTLLWKHFINAYIWDKSNNFLRIHSKLTNDHFWLNSTLKMRNHLAEEVLNSDMLLLLKEYRDALTSGDYLNPAIKLVEITSQFINIFRSSQPICSLQDERLCNLATIKSFFMDWKDYCDDAKMLHIYDKQIFVTDQCYQDIVSCINGFVSLCHEKLPDTAVIPRLINSDVCENIFCQQRTTYSGANANPDASQYRYTFHIVIITLCFAWTHMGCTHFKCYMACDMEYIVTRLLTTWCMDVNSFGMVALGWDSGIGSCDGKSICSI